MMRRGKQEQRTIRLGWRLGVAGGLGAGTTRSMARLRAGVRDRIIAATPSGSGQRALVLWAAALELHLSTRSAERVLALWAAATMTSPAVMLWWLRGTGGGPLEWGTLGMVEIAIAAVCGGVLVLCAASDARRYRERRFLGPLVRSATGWFAVEVIAALGVVLLLVGCAYAWSYLACIGMRATGIHPVALWEWRAGERQVAAGAVLTAVWSTVMGVLVRRVVVTVAVMVVVVGACHLFAPVLWGSGARVIGPWTPAVAFGTAGGVPAGWVWVSLLVWYAVPLVVAWWAATRTDGG